jgi:hypothetical protein
MEYNKTNLPLLDSFCGAHMELTDLIKCDLMQIYIGLHITFLSDIFMLINENII